MILSDGDIRHRLREGDLILDPAPDDIQIQPASVDCRLSNTFIRFNDGRGVLDTKDKGSFEGASYSETLQNGDSVIIRPQEFLLASLRERLELPSDLVATVEGRSSLARLGLIVHTTAGYVDPGFRGNITLELCNLNNRPIVLYVGMRIAQLSFHKTFGVLRPYGEVSNKYQDQPEQPVTSKVYNDIG